MLNGLVGMLGVGGGVATNFDSIATYSVGGGGSSTIVFSSIPSTYKHLQIRGLSGNAGGAGNSLNMYFNTDSTTTNYYHHNLRGDGGGTATAGNGNTYRVSYVGGASPNFAGLIIDILDYADTNKYKTVKTLGGYDANGSGWIALNSELWKSTSAVNAITLTADGGNSFQQYSHFALYGIKA